jgi:branched-chain amino acid transport system substrate-binding protein
MSMALKIALMTGCVLAFTPVLAAEPVRIGVTTILSGPYADRGQSEQYGVELALQRINQAGGVLGRPVEAFYGDNAADPATGIAAAKRLIEEQHVPVLLGALWTPVTHAIMPIVAEAKVPLVIDISAGQDFVDASGVGGDDYAFKTIPSDRDIALGLIGWLKGKGVHTVAIVSDDLPFNQVNADSMAKAAVGADIKVLANETIAKDTKDLAPLLGELKALAPDQVVTLLSGSTAPFFRAYEQSGWNVPITGRVDFAAATGAVSPEFLASGGLDGATSITVFNPLIETPGVQDFVRAYRAKYGIMPTQRSFFAFEATNLVADAIRRANSDRSEDIERALKTTAMPSLLGGTYAMDDHNHPHTPMQILGVRGGKPGVIAQIGG